MRARVLILCIGISLNAVPMFCQMYSCSSIQGDWQYYYDESKQQLSQDSSGNITGLDLEPLCPGYTFPVTGKISSTGSFTFTISNLNRCPGDFNSWTTFTGNLGQPGCNYAFGTWNNALGHSGSFGYDTAYPPPGNNLFTKPVDVPTSETSVQSGTWNTTLGGAPWHQTLAPNSPSGEFSGRVVYEYATGTGTDSCWFQGSIFKQPFNSITTPGYPWSVNGKNLWGPDDIGWQLKAVQYYRTQKRAPCGARFQQQMVMDAAYAPNDPQNYGPYTDENGVSFYGIPYEVNSLGADITATTVTSIRNGKVATNTTWK